MNSVNIMGRLTAEPEMRLTPNQTQVCTFNLAVDAGKDKKAYFFSCVAWKTTAVNIQKYFHKGDKIAISGILTSRMYEDKEGHNRTVVEILINSFDFCEGKKNADQGQQAEQPQEQAQQIIEQAEQQLLPFEI